MKVNDEMRPLDNPGYYIDDTGHRVYKGSRWHLPKTGEPTKCAVEGCPRVLGQRVDRRPDATTRGYQ